MLQRRADLQRTGNPWLTKLPKDWQLLRLKFLCEINPGKSEIASMKLDTSVSFLPMELIGDDGTLTLTETRELGQVYAGFTYFREGDVVVAKITPCFENGKGAICKGLVNGIGFGTTELHVLRPKSFLDNRFLYYITHSELFRNTGTALMTGAAGQKRVPPSFLADFEIGVPSVEEQRAIADFLYEQTAKIDALIDKKRQLIALLQEKRTALISHAVTKGLDPTMPMKESGVAWLGEMPAHWTLLRLKYVSKIQSGLTLGRDLRNRETIRCPYLRVANVQDGYLDLDEITYVDILPHEVDRYRLQHGDVLMTEGGDFDKLGRGYVWDSQIDDMLHQNHVFAVRVDRHCIKPHYLAHLTASLHGKNYFTSTSQQTTNLATINQQKLNNFPIPLPPIKEQQEILNLIAVSSAYFKRLLTLTADAISKLEEYRTALISAAVTGQIDVRPHVAPAPSPTFPETLEFPGK